MDKYNQGGRDQCYAMDNMDILWSLHYTIYYRTWVVVEVVACKDVVSWDCSSTAGWCWAG